MVLLGDEPQVEACFGLFRDSVTLTQDMCMVSSNIPKARKSFWTHPMELLFNVGHVESYFGLFGDSVSVGARRVPSLRQTYHRLENHFGRT
jgi:hypothetical protein